MTKEDSRIILEAFDDKLAVFLENVDSKIRIVVKEELEPIKNDVAILKGDVAILKGDVANVKGGLKELKEVVEGMQTVMATKADIIDLKNEMRNNHQNHEKRLRALEQLAA